MEEFEYNTPMVNGVIGFVDKTNLFEGLDLEITPEMIEMAAANEKREEEERLEKWDELCEHQKAYVLLVAAAMHEGCLMSVREAFPEAWQQFADTVTKQLDAMSDEEKVKLGKNMSDRTDIVPQFFRDIGATFESYKMAYERGCELGIVDFLCFVFAGTEGCSPEIQGDDRREWQDRMRGKG
jgi:hypothetical protein